MTVMINYSYLFCLAVLYKGWHFLRTYVLTLARFDLFLQGALLIVILLETNVLLLLRRHYNSGFTPAAAEGIRNYTLNHRHKYTINLSISYQISRYSDPRGYPRG